MVYTDIVKKDIMKNRNNWNKIGTNKRMVLTISNKKDIIIL